MEPNEPPTGSTYYSYRLYSCCYSYPAYDLSNMGGNYRNLTGYPHTEGDKIIPLAIRYLRARAGFYASIRAICKGLRRSAYDMMCKHADEAILSIIKCDLGNNCDKCKFLGECIRRYDNLIDIG